MQVAYQQFKRCQKRTRIPNEHEEALRLKRIEAKERSLVELVWHVAVQSLLIRQLHHTVRRLVRVAMILVLMAIEGPVGRRTTDLAVQAQAL